MARIKKINFIKHKILGDLKLDFTDSKGNVADTVIIAGENGLGKTTILSAIYELVTGNIRFEAEVEYDVNGEEFDVKYKKEPGVNVTLAYCGNKTYAPTDPDFTTLIPMSAIYSVTDINYDSYPITRVSSLDTDLATEALKSTSKTATEIKQLLVDIETLDNSTIAEHYKKNGRTIDKSEKIELRMDRFVNAYNKMFDNKLTYNSIANDGEKKNILFSKGLNNIDIDNLSSGEKQIVYRSTFLLKDTKSLKSPLVLIDEPEISLHPKWQRKILPFYQELFTENGVQSSQIMVSSHSDTIIASAIDCGNKALIVVLNEHGPEVESTTIKDGFILPTITSAEINYKAFGIYSKDFHIALYGYLQTKTGLDSIKACDNFINAYPGLLPIHKAKTINSKDGKTEYFTLPTAIRNEIDHPGCAYSFSQEELKISTELLRELCK